MSIYCSSCFRCYSLHNNAPSSSKLLKIGVLTYETCWAVNWHNKASVIKLAYLYSNNSVSWFPTFALLWMLCSLVFVIPRLLNFMWRRFGTLCSVFIGSVNKTRTLGTEHNVPKSSAVTFRHRGITQRNNAIILNNCPKSCDCMQFVTYV